LHSNNSKPNSLVELGSKPTFGSYQWNPLYKAPLNLIVWKRINCSVVLGFKLDLDAANMGPMLERNKTLRLFSMVGPNYFSNGLINNE